MNPKPEIRNPKPETPNTKPQIESNQISRLLHPLAAVPETTPVDEEDLVSAA